MFDKAVAVFLCTCLILASVACSSRKVVRNPQAGTVVERVEVGDFVSIAAKNGRTYSVEVIEVGDQYLRGVDPNSDKRYRIPYSQIQAMTYESFNAGETAAATAGGLLVLYVVSALVVAYMFSRIGDSFGDSWDGGGGC